MWWLDGMSRARGPPPGKDITNRAARRLRAFSAQYARARKIGYVKFTSTAVPDWMRCGSRRRYLAWLAAIHLRSLDVPAEFGARGELHLKRRAFARRRHDPDAPAVHLHDLLGDGEPEACAALCLGKGTVDLVELLEDPILLVEWYARPGVRYRDREVAIPRARRDAHFAGVGELDGIANEIEEHLCEALFVTEANGRPAAMLRCRGR